MTATGMLVLAVPAFSLNFRKKSLKRIGDIIARRSQSGEKSALDKIAEEIRDNRANDTNTWRSLDEKCLYLGYFLMLGAAIWRLAG